MIAAAVLLLYAVLAAVHLPRLGRMAAWAERAPRLAITMWQAACASVVASALLAAVAFAVPAEALGHGLAGLFEACAAMMDSGVTLTSAGAVALLVAGTALVRLGWCGAAVLFRAGAERREHVAWLRLLGRHDRNLGAIVLDHDERLAYCVPGRHARMVITTGALRALAPEQVAAVLAHERAHLRGRHHLVIAAAEALVTAFPGVPVFEHARTEVARLIELLADDVAARRHPRVQLAAALVGLATGRAPGFALGAGGETALTRVRRMVNPALPLRRGEHAAGLLTVGLLLCGPGAVALAPGLVALLAHHCHELLT
ncbi:M56 family metallopeptidase [Nonomuraea pusilla]|uniref:Zn-dependent protease with chaperone function n=1 Tax=Nonomuraea pusilla TaxID=46177 RepID=A0A1H7QPS2_9ACTN|nr:M56 family metallopeptidase [Nonomuraea pusilla]SEL49909.1 Zn-dependent protease with chaperone function [Nonomuraea pusilla]